MKIKHWMTPNPITVSPETLIIDAKKIMKEKNIRRLPVVDNDRLVGMVTYRNIIEASPSAATSLSVHELNYLVLKLQVKDVMRKNPITVSPDDYFTSVILEGHRKGIGSFPVVDQGRLVGIVTETEIYSAMVHIFGTRAQSEILCLQNAGSEDSVGDFRRIAQFMEERQIPILAMFSLPRRDSEGLAVYVRVKTKDTDRLWEELRQNGYETCDE